MFKHYIKPEEVTAEEAQKVLDFLNSAQTAQEIGNTIEIPGELDVGIRVGQRILDKRTELGGQFSNLQQVRDIPYVGPERFTEIVAILTGRPITRIIEEGVSVSQLLRELDELRAVVKALQTGMAIRYQVTLQPTKQNLFVGQPVTLFAKVVDTRNGKPVPNVCLTLTSNWGILQTFVGFEMRKGRVVTAITDLNGLAKVELFSPTVEQLKSAQQYALETALRQLDPEAETPADAANGFEEMVNRYQMESDTDLRSAIDIYFRARRESLTDAINHSINWGDWSYHDCLVTAYMHDVEDSRRVSSTSVHSMAALIMRFKDWLEPWYHTYLSLLEGTSTLTDEIVSACEGVTDKAEILDAILGNLYAYIGVQPGWVGESIGQKVAQKSINHFMATAFDELPLDTRQSLYPALSIASKSIGAANMGTLAVASRIRIDVNQDVDSRIGQLGDLDALTTMITGVQGQIVQFQDDYKQFADNYADFNVNYNDFNTKYNNFDEDYDTFNTSYANFTRDYGAFDENYATFSYNYKIFSANYGSFTTNYQTFTTDYNQFKRDLASQPIVTRPPTG